MKENIGRYKDRDHYLGVALGIVDDLSHHVLQILSLSSVQELRDEKEEVDPSSDDANSGPGLYFTRQGERTSGRH